MKESLILMNWTFAKRGKLFMVKVEDVPYVSGSCVSATMTIASGYFAINTERLSIVTDEQSDYVVKLLEHLIGSVADVDRFETNSVLYEEEFGKYPMPPDNRR